MKTFKILKEELENKNLLAEQLFLLGRDIATKIHYFHLTTSSYSEHMATNAFYDGIIPLIDSFSESYIGKYGKFDANFPIFTGIKYSNAINMISEFNNWIKNNRNSICKDSEIQNIIDEIVSLNDSTLYKLKELH